MKNNKLKIGASIFVIAVVVASVVFISGNSVEASRYMVKDGDVFMVGESLNSSMHITNSNDIQMLFDEKESKLLLGKGIKSNVPETERRGGTELFIINNDGSGELKLTDDLVTESFFSTDGSNVYYVTIEKNLFEVDIQTHQKTLLKERVFEIALSHDNSMIAYHKLNNDWQPGDYYENALGIAILDLKTKKETQVTSGWDDFFPIWTKDDSKIIFYAANSGGLVSQFVVDVDGKNRKQSTNIGQVYYSNRTVDHATGKPEWSPNGKVLVYETDNKIWINDFTQGYDNVKAEKVAFGKSPKWINDEMLSLIVTESSNAKNGVIKIDKKGNIIK